MSSYRRWTREQEDVDRLPHGMVRTAYDADTRQYTFFDTTEGIEYVSAPGEAYGTLVPAATANFPKTTRTSGRKTIIQAYDRPVVFADDTGIQPRRSSQPSMGHGHKRNPTMPPSSSRHNSSSNSGSTRKQGRKRSASFSDFIPPHLIARASNPSDVVASKPRKSTGARGRTTISAPPSPPSSSPVYGDEKKNPEKWVSSPTDPLLSLPTLSASPPPLPPKDYPPSSVRQKEQESGETCVPHVAVRLTARVLGRTLGAAKSAQRSPKGQSADDEWVLV